MAVGVSLVVLRVPILIELACVGPVQVLGVELVVESVSHTEDPQFSVSAVST